MPELPYPRRVLTRPRRLQRLRARAGKLFDKFATLASARVQNRDEQKKTNLSVVFRNLRD